MKENLQGLQSLGVTEEQVLMVDKHLQVAKKFVYPSDLGVDAAVDWLKGNLDEYLEPDEAGLLLKIAQKNMPDLKVEYLESGYDSSQSHRKVAKVVGEALLLGGVIYESGLLGIDTDLKAAKSIINSELIIDEKDVTKLVEISQKYGGQQDFLFPGVTPSSSETPSLEEMVYLALAGKPVTSVRNVTGVGGLRYDKDWNYVTDWATFAELKVKEDKRYYPGLVIFHYLLLKYPEQIPVIAELKELQKSTCHLICSFSEKLKALQKVEISGVSVLCSVYLPAWSELKLFSGYASPAFLGSDLAEAFHSPAYDFSVLANLFKTLSKGEALTADDVRQSQIIFDKLHYCWTFNSTIHLPWTVALAGLSNDLIGKVTNTVGDYCIRYGIGHSGKSVEVREYHFGFARKFPAGISGQTAYGVRVYPDSDSFTGSYEQDVLLPDSNLWKKIKKDGFMKAAIDFLIKKKDEKIINTL